MASWVLKCLTTLLAISAAGVSSLPSSMRAVVSTGKCGAPFQCVGVESAAIPHPEHGAALIRLSASSVSPKDVDMVEMVGCDKGCGTDAAGTIVACPGCQRLKVGDAVWGFANQAYAQYATGSELFLGRLPPSIDMLSAAALTSSGLTSYFSLKRTGSPPGSPLPVGSPWETGNFSNLTVLITAGAGGTGVVGIQLAKAWGAKHILTATTGEDGFEFVKSAGATYVTDYKVHDIFDTLPDNSVDIVYDNYGAIGTADKAMRTIRTGGSYLLMPHSGCYFAPIQGPPCLSAFPKAGVRQLTFDTTPDFSERTLQGLDEMSGLIAAGQLSARIAKTFQLQDIRDAFTYSTGSGAGGVGHHLGKIAISIAETEARTVLMM